jgi:dUTP pyrophosphatase
MSNATHTIQFLRTDKRAVLPTRGNSFAVGHDLTAISVYKKIGSKITLYDTGLQCKPPTGYYTEIHGRSSIVKTGYTVSNCVGIIDEDYRGQLIIAVTKVDDTFPDLEVPFVKCQLILRKAEYYESKEVESLDETERGSGGFGSTDRPKAI